MAHPRPPLIEVLDEGAQMLLARSLRSRVLEEGDANRGGRLHLARLEALADLAVLDRLLLQLLVLDGIERRCSASKGQRCNQSETGSDPKNSDRKSTRLN